MAAPTVRSTSGAYGNINGGVAFSTIAALPTIASGDLLVLWVETAAEAFTIPTGWTEISSSPQSIGTAAGASSTRLTICTKTADGSDDPTMADSGNHTIAGMASITHGGGTPTVHVTAGDTGASDTAVTFPSVTTTEADCLILNLVTNVQDTSGGLVSGWTNSNLAGFAELWDNNTTNGNGGGIGVGSGTLASAGSTGSSTATLSMSSPQARITLAIAPPASGGTTSSVTAAAITHTGQSITVSAATNISVTAAAMTYTAQALSVIRSTVVSVTAATITYTGRALGTGGAVAGVVNRLLGFFTSSIRF
jgi:hypothetical protein